MTAVVPKVKHRANMDAKDFIILTILIILGDDRFSVVSFIVVLENIEQDDSRLAVTQLKEIEIIGLQVV